MEKKIGKIEKISVGFGGYQNAMLGLSVTISSKGWGTGTFKGFWGPNIEHSALCKWAEKERMQAHAETLMYIGKLLIEAKRETVEELKDVPVEVTFDGGQLVAWRILSEVI